MVWIGLHKDFYITRHCLIFIADKHDLHNSFLLKSYNQMEVCQQWQSDRTGRMLNVNRLKVLTLSCAKTVLPTIFIVCERINYRAWTAVQSVVWLHPNRDVPDFQDPARGARTSFISTPLNGTPLPSALHRCSLSEFPNKWHLSHRDTLLHVTEAQTISGSQR